jgi:hypothetical protein
MPTIAGGDCGIVKQVDAEGRRAAAVLALRRRPRGLLPRPQGLDAGTQSADDAAAVRAELIGLHSPLARRQGRHR